MKETTRAGEICQCVEAAWRGLRGGGERRGGWNRREGGVQVQPRIQAVLALICVIPPSLDRDDPREDLFPKINCPIFGYRKRTTDG